MSDADDFPLDEYLDDPEQRYYLLASQINMLLDRGECPTVEEVEERVFDGTVFDWIEEKYGVKLWLHGRDRAMGLGAFRSLATIVPTARKFGVSRNGLCMLIAYCLETTRSPLSWEDPQDDPSFPRA
jgi:hypothetical protein